jgi:hypothetical protein
MMAQRRKHFWRSFLSPANIVLLLAVVAAVSTPVVTSLVNRKPVEPVLWGILAFLAAMSVSQVVANYQSIRRDERLSELADRVAAEGKVTLRRRRELTPLPECASSARDILIVSRAPLIVLRNENFLADRLRAGAIVRVTMCNPANKPLVAQIATFTGRSPEETEREIHDALSLARRIEADSGHAGALAVRLTDYMPTLCFCAVDSEHEGGHLVVELIPRGVDVFERPHILLDPKRDPEWFGYFICIAESVWDGARPYPVDNEPAAPSH